jgi:hypothetical protein
MMHHPAKNKRHWWKNRSAGNYRIKRQAQKRCLRRNNPNPHRGTTQYLAQRSVICFNHIGYQQECAAEKSVDAVLKKSGNTVTLEDLVKQALKN